MTKHIRLPYSMLLKPSKYESHSQAQEKFRRLKKIQSGKLNKENGLQEWNIYLFL